MHEIGEIPAEEAEHHCYHVDGDSVDLCLCGGETEVLEDGGCKGCCCAGGDVA